MSELSLDEFEEKHGDGFAVPVMRKDIVKAKEYCEKEIEGDYALDFVDLKMWFEMETDAVIVKSIFLVF